MDNQNAVSTDALAGIAIGTAAINSALDIYDERFLFGADNVFAVRQLTYQALATHASAAMFGTNENNPSRVPLTISFEQAAMHLIENQAICTPGSILEISRDAIGDADVRPIVSDADDESAPGTAGGGDANAELSADMLDALRDLEPNVRSLLFEGLSADQRDTVEAAIANDAADASAPRATPPPAGWNSVGIRVGGEQ